MTTTRKNQRRNQWCVTMQRTAESGAQLYWYPTEDAARLAFADFSLTLKPYYQELSNPRDWLVLSEYNR